MAFTRIDKSVRSYALDGQAVATMGAYLADGKVHKGRSVSFRISRALIDQLGWEAIDGKMKVGVFEGTGEDAGFLQLVPDPQGYSSSFPEGKQGFAISITIERFKHYVLNECPVSMTVVNHIVEKDMLVVECPDWLRFNPQSVPQPEPKTLPSVHQLPTTNRRQRRAVATEIARALKK